MENKFTGMILSKYDVGEADRLYAIYTKEMGKIRAKAVGVRKPGARLAASLENFTLSDITIVKKQGIGKITSSIIENSFLNIRNNLDSLAAVFEALRIFDRLIIQEEKDEKVFGLLSEFLETLNKIKKGGKEKIEILSQGFIFKLLDLLGYKIEANVCASCAVKLSGKNDYFSAPHGGIVCNDCAKGSGDVFKTSINTIKLIRIFFSNNPRSFLKIKTGEKEIRELKIISKIFLDWLGK